MPCWGGLRKRYADVTDHVGTVFDNLVLRPKANTNATLLAKALASQQYGVIRAKGFIHNQDGLHLLLQVVEPRWQLAVVPDGSVCQSDCAIICIGLRGRLNKTGLSRFCRGCHGN